MRIHSSLLVTAERGHEKSLEILRGYDPLQEIYLWNGIASLLLGEAGIICWASIPLFRSLFLFQGTFDDIRIIYLFVILILLYIFFSLFIPLRRYRYEKGQRETSRRNALIIVDYKQLPVVNRQFSPSDKWFEQLHMESKPKEVFPRSLVTVVVLFAVLLTFNYLTFFGPDWARSTAWAMFTMLLAMGTLNLGLLPRQQTLRLRLADYYLLPSLKADEEGIIARYGRETVAMRWRDIRYFALVDGASFRKIADPRQKTPASTLARAAYEISDGENRICWLDGEPFSSQLLLLNGEVEMSREQYEIFAQQLAAQVIEHTGLPLYDFRIQKKGKKKD